MSSHLRRLNDEGVCLFSEYLQGGAQGRPPLGLLENPETSDQMAVPISLGSGVFSNRFDFGIYLRTLFKGFDAAAVAADRNLWNSLALFWFDQFCPEKQDGSRVLGEEYRYILSSDYRHYYRHLARSPWYLVNLHGDNARILLMAPRSQDYSLSVHGEILEQLAGRQQVLGSRLIIAAANRMYLDPVSGRPRNGVAGRGRGSANRFGIVLRQLDLTYDPEAMADGALISVLPAEFDRWKQNKNLATKAATPATHSVHGEAASV